MEKHVVVCLNSAKIPLTDKCGSSRHGEGNSVDNASGSSPALGISTDSKLEELVISEEERPLLQLGECRICQDEDHVKNLESPCACSGNLKYAHRKCLQRWCNEKGDVICEICHQVHQVVKDHLQVNYSKTLGRQLCWKLDGLNDHFPPHEQTG